MILLKSDHLAETLRQNWIDRYPSDGEAREEFHALDDSLTNLQWLHDLNLNFDNHLNGTNGADLPYNASVSSNGPYISPLRPIDYKTNHTVKPPFSYTTLICMAMGETQSKEITLASIYNWIRKNFVYYRVASPSWQNSIRHNLSLSKYFEKVPRRGNEPGKGGYWRISPQYREALDNGSFIKKRLSCESYNHFYENKRLRRTPETNLSLNQNEPESAHYNSPEVPTTSEQHTNNVDWKSFIYTEDEHNLASVRVKTEKIVDVTNNFASPLVAMNYINSDDYSAEPDLQQFVSCNSQSNNDLNKSYDYLDIADWWLKEHVEVEDTSRENESFKGETATSLLNDEDFDLFKRDLYEDIAAAFNVENLTAVPIP